MIEIRTSTSADWPRIIDIYNHAVTDGRCTADIHPVTVEERESWLQQHLSERYPIRVAVENGIVIGWCSLSPWRAGREALSGVAEISYYIDRRHRGKGCGDMLMSDTIDYAKTIGFKHLLAILVDINKASLKLLGKHGFQQWGRLPDVADFGSLICGQSIHGKHLQTKPLPPKRIAAIL